MTTLDASTRVPARRLVSPGLLLCLAAGCAEPPPAPTGPAPEPHLLQGHWDARNESDEYWMNIEGDSLYYYSRPDFQYDTTFKLIPGADPPQLRATILDTPRSTDSAGEVVFVIYELADDSLTMGVFDENGEGPPSFDEVVSLNEFVRGEPRE
jgi:hypothetical protein